jgi:hypothetical protein
MGRQLGREVGMEEEDEDGRNTGNTGPEKRGDPDKEVDASSDVQNIFFDADVGHVYSRYASDQPIGLATGHSNLGRIFVRRASRNWVFAIMIGICTRLEF